MSILKEIINVDWKNKAYAVEQLSTESLVAPTYDDEPFGPKRNIDPLTQLQANMNQLKALQGQFRFMVQEIKMVTKS